LACISLPVSIIVFTTSSKEEVVQQPYSVQELTRMLDEAVRNEEYEKASKIRDLLKEMGK
jgi:uncharacterized protein